MREFILKKPKKILENKKVLEKKLNLKMEVLGRKLTINGSEIEEFLASKVIDASELGFEIDTALMLIDEDYVFEKIEIKNLTKRTNRTEIRARLIGREGRTKEIIEELSECYLCIAVSEVGIIGPGEKIKNAMHAVKSIIQGSRQASVYTYLEKQRKILHPSDLGLRINEE